MREKASKLGVSLLSEANRDFSSPAEALAHAYHELESRWHGPQGLPTPSAVLTAGPTLNNQASDDNSRRPTG